jgi:hypothetical protein
MFSSRHRRIAAALALVFISPALQGGVGARQNFEERLLAAHNRERAALGVPPLKWDETLAMGKIIPGARLAMFYGLAHPLKNVPVTRVAEAVGQWIREVVPA